MDDYHYVQDVPADLLCAVCYHALREPRCCPRCQKAFCAECITTWASTQKRKEVPFSCPYCRARLRLTQLFRPAALEGRLGELPVMCPNGCPSPLRRSDLATHIATCCPGAPDRCPDCDASMPRSQLSAHTGSSNCPNRRLPCPNAPLGCAAYLQLPDIPYHVASCPYEPLACRNCGADVLRGQAEEHFWGGCPARCACPNRAFGCKHVAPSLEALGEHVLRNPGCPYSDSSAHMARMRAAMGPGELVYGRSRSSRVSGGGGGGSPHPLQHTSGGRHAASDAAVAAALAAVGLYGMGDYAADTATHGPAAREGTWCHGLFIPAALYPDGLPEPPEPVSTAVDDLSGGDPGGGAGTALPPPPWPWVVDSTREAGDAAAAAAIERHFVPAPDADRLRHEHQHQQQEQQQQQARGRAAVATATLVTERCRRLLEAVARGSPEEAEEEVAGMEMEGLAGTAIGAREGTSAAGDGVMGDVGGAAGSAASAAPAATAADLISELELGLQPFWWRGVGAEESQGRQVRATPAQQQQAEVQQQQQQQQEQPPPSGSGLVGGSNVAEGADEEAVGILACTDYLTLPAAKVYGTLINLMERLYERGSVPAAAAAAGGDGNRDGDSDGGAAAGSSGELPDPPEGSSDEKLLQLYEGQDNSLLDLPACDTGLHHGYRAFWALGLMRLARRHWPSARLHWRALAALNDLTTNLARRLLGAVVAVIGCELVQESAPMGEGDVVLAVQSLFPPPLAAEVLESVRRTLRMYDDAFWESDLWLEGWSSLRVKLELGLELGRVACLVAQYTPLHGEFVAGENDPTSDDSDDDDSDDDDDGDDDMVSSSSEESDDDSGGRVRQRDGEMDEDDNGDIEAVPRAAAARRQAANTAGGVNSLPPLVPSNDTGRRRGNSGGAGAGAGGAAAAGGGAGGAGSSNHTYVRAPVLELLNDTGRRIRGLELGTTAAAAAAALGGRRRGQGRGPASGSSSSDSDDTTSEGDSDSSGDWESMDSEEAAALMVPQQPQQNQQAASEQQPPAGVPEANHAAAAATAVGTAPAATVPAPAAAAGAAAPPPAHWWQRRLNERMGLGSDNEYGSAAGGSEGFTGEMDVASSDTSRADTGRSHADIRGVVALAAALEWFAVRLLEVSKSYVGSGLMRLGDGGRLHPWHLQLALDTSPLGQVLLQPQERAADPAAAVASGQAPWPGTASGAVHSAGSGFWDGPSVGGKLVGALPLQPFARMMASLALQPVSALLVLATAGATVSATAAAGVGETAAAGVGDGAAAAAAAAAPPPPVLCPLDVRCYCGAPARGVPLSGPPCSFWSGYQCAGCATATQRVRQLPFDKQMNLCGGVLRAVLRSAISETCGEQGAPPPAPAPAPAPVPTAAAGLHPPSDLVAAVTGGHVRGELLRLLLPPQLRQLLQPQALSYAAEMANLGLTSGLLRIHHLDVPYWWRQPGGTAVLPLSAAAPAASVAPAADAADGSSQHHHGGVLMDEQPKQRELLPRTVLAAALSPPLAAAVRPDLSWLQQLQPHLAGLHDVQAAVNLCRDIGAVLYGTSNGERRDGSGAAATASGREAAPSLSAEADGQVAGDASGGGASGGNDSGAGGSGSSPALGSSGPAAMPLCIPKSDFMALFEEAWDTVRCERNGASETHPASGGVGGGAAQSHQQRQHAAGSAARRRGEAGPSPSVPPAMGLATDGPVRRLFRPTPVGGGSGRDAATRGSVRPRAAPGDAAAQRRPAAAGTPVGGTEPDPGAGLDLVSEAEAPQDDMEVDGESTELGWSSDALELLQRAAEATLTEALQAGGADGIAYRAGIGACGGAGGGGGRWGRFGQQRPL